MLKQPSKTKMDNLLINVNNTVTKLHTRTEHYDTKKLHVFPDKIWDQHEPQTTAMLILANKGPGPAVLLRCLVLGCAAEAVG